MECTVSQEQRCSLLKNISTSPELVHTEMQRTRSSRDESRRHGGQR